MQGSDLPPNAPPPPPGATNAPPPPPGQVQLNHEEQRIVDELRRQVQALQVQNDEDAKAQLKRLHEEHYGRYSRAQREQVLPLETRITALTRELETALQEQDLTLASTLKAITKLNETMLEIQRQKEIFQDNAVMLRRLRASEEGTGTTKSLAERLREAEAKRDFILRTKLELEEENRQAIATLRRQVSEAKARIAPLKAYADAVPAPRVRKAVDAQPAPAARQSFSIQPWIESGFIKGIYLENLKQFIMKADNVDDMDETITDEHIIQKYNEFARNPAFDERIIIGIACGYIYKDDFHKNDLTPMQGAKIEPGLKSVFEGMINQLYDQFKDLRQTAVMPIDTANPEPQLQQMEQFIEQQATKANVALRTTAVAPSQPRPATTPQTLPPLRRTDKKAKEEKQEETRPALNPSLAQIDERRERLEREHQQASRDYVKPLSREKPDTRQVVELYDRVTNGNIGAMEALGIRDLNEQMQRGQLSEEAIALFRALNDKLVELDRSGLFTNLPIRPDLSFNDLIRTATIAFSQMKGKATVAETPTSILTEKRSKGFLQAVELYKSTHEGKKPSVTEMSKWIKAAKIEGTELRTVQQMMKKIR